MANASDKPLSFQEIILRLQSYWAGQGCAVLSPYNSEVGAGTFNPATFLRSLGPEPWRVAYVEPSKRPKDGRYLENPNRVHQFLQYQVVLKPEPPNVVELYLESLAQLADPRRLGIESLHASQGLVGGVVALAAGSLQGGVVVLVVPVHQAVLGLLLGLGHRLGDVEVDHHPPVAPVDDGATVLAPAGKIRPRARRKDRACPDAPV
mgnify:CR=1 FL=1